MRNSEFKAIEKRLAAHLPGFRLKGRLMFLVPVESVLRGFYFEPSGFAKDRFYLEAFFQPLFVPANEITFLFGRRLGDNKRWRSDEPDLESALLSSMKAEVPKLLRLNNAETIASALEVFAKMNAVGFVNPHCREAFAYALVKAREIERANQVLGILINSIDTTVTWQREIESRAIRIREMLLKQPQDAIEQLAAWEAETARTLGLEEFLDSTVVVAGRS